MLLKELQQALALYAIQIPHEAERRLVQYLEAMQKWNRTYNLTRIIEPKESVYLHIVDSLLIAPYLQGVHCLDVGSGAGLPGIPLAICYPDKQWTLLDKSQKKTRFLLQMQAELGLSNVQVASDRAEHFQVATRFDTIVSRALSSLLDFVTMSRHLLLQDGEWLAMKGQYPHEEIATLPSDVGSEVFALPASPYADSRHIVRLWVRQ